MQTDELKKLLKGSTAVLILENGEPSFVILGYDAYKSLLDGQEKEIQINRSGAERSNIDFVKPIADADSSLRARNRLQTDQVSTENQFRHRVGEKESELLEKINKQILSLKNEIDKEEKGTGSTGKVD